MAEAIKYPVDDGSQVQWTVVGAASAAVAWRDESDSSYVVTDTNDRYHLVTVEELPSNVLTVESVVVNVRIGSVGGGSAVKAVAIYNSSTAYSTSFGTSAGIENYTTDAIPCPDLDEWTPAKFNATEFGIYSQVLETEDVVSVYRLSVTASVTAAAAAPSGRPYYRFHLTKDIKPVRLHRKKGD